MNPISEVILTHAPQQFRWTSASRSHVGMVRDINEDACLDQPARGLWAVADGMGGHTLGDFASRMVVETLNQIPPVDSIEEFIAGVQDRLQAVNRQLRNEAVMRNALVIGSTVVVLLACDRFCAYLWAGDSRLYLYRNGELRLLTRDHSHVEELISSGALRSEDALTHPARNLITRAVGAADMLDLEQETIKVADGDIYLLCSDGLTNELTEQQMCAALSTGNCRQAVEALVDLALKHGGRDNISAVAVHAEDILNNDLTVLNPAL